jgi:outer membrane protein assembly factor BamB
MAGCTPSGITGIVSAFDAATGKLAWQTPAAPEHPSYGTAVSPVGDKDLVIVHPGNHGPLTAFDANSGAVRWTGTDRGAYASPIIVELGGIRQVVTMTQESVLGVSLSDGASCGSTRGSLARRRAPSRRSCTRRR